MTHLLIDQVMAYVQGTLSQDEASALEEHIADCEGCLARVRAHHALREGFDSLWSTWPARQHARERLLARIREALATSAIRSDLHSRVSSFRRQIVGRISHGLRIVIRATDGTATLIEDGLEALFPERRPAPFSLTPHPVAVGGSGGPSAVVEAESEGIQWARVAVDPVLRKVIVQASAQTGPLPLAVLISECDGSARVEELRPVEGTDQLAVEFEELPDGGYLLLLEQGMADAEGN